MNRLNADQRPLFGAYNSVWPTKKEKENRRNKVKNNIKKEVRSLNYDYR